MVREWVFETEGQSSGKGADNLWLGLRDETGRVAKVTPPCRSFEEFSREISSLKGELDRMIEAARQRFEQGTAGGKSEIESPEQAWKKMAAMGSEQEMFDYFNALGLGARQEIAEYVFSKVNMFKGMGPVFSEHYDSESSLLE